MGLSNLSPKETVDVYQAILEVAKHVKTLAEDPKALEKTILDAYSLTESEQAKVDKARSDTAKYQSLVDEQRKNLADLLAKADALDTKREELDEIQGSIDKIRASLATQETILKNNQLQLGSDQKTLADDRAKFDAEKAESLKFKLSLDERDKILDTREEALDAKLEKLINA